MWNRPVIAIATCAAFLVVGALVHMGSPLRQLKGHAIRPVNLIGSAKLRSEDHLEHFFPAVPAEGATLPHRAHSLEEFAEELKVVLDNQQLPTRAVNWIFKNYHVQAQPHPNCQGTWLEFGVAKGKTINLAADFRSKYCADDAQPIYGFDTFTGLPEDWGSQDHKGSFSLEGKLPDVRKNVQLIQGLFSDSLPPFLKQHYEARKELKDVTYLHIDCDLYQGAIDALTLLDKHIAPGCILLFDDLINYPIYLEHELKALWEWLAATGRQLQVIGVLGPLPGDKKGDPDKTYAMEMHPPHDMGWFHQSVAFVVL